MFVGNKDMSLRSFVRPTNLWSLIIQMPQTDPIIAEIRAVRDKHAAQFDYDVDAIFKDIQARQTTSGRKYVRRPPK